MSHTNSTPKPEANMSDHTPGPWTVNDIYIESAHGCRPGETEVLAVVVGRPNKLEHNARLIAAAPEMHALLLQIHTELSHTASADADPANWEGYTLHRIEKLLWAEGSNG